MLRSVKSTQRQIRQLELKVIAGTISHSIAAAAVDATANTFTVAAEHGLLTNDRVLVTEVGTLPAGLTTATQYWVIKVSATAFKLATTSVNALAGTAINITDVGTGSNTYAAVEKLSGPASQQAVLHGTALGTYLVTFDQPFVQAPIAIAMPHARDYVASIVTTTTTAIIKLDDLDETAALKDGFFDLLIIGSDISDKY